MVYYYIKGGIYMKLILLIAALIIWACIYAKIDKAYHKNVIKQALDEHEKEKANDKSRE